MMCAVALKPAHSRSLASERIVIADLLMHGVDPVLVSTARWLALVGRRVGRAVCPHIVFWRTNRETSVSVMHDMNTTPTTARSGRGRWIAAAVVALIVLIGIVLLVHSGGGGSGGGGY
jgi:hypothetical protein